MQAHSDCPSVIRTGKLIVLTSDARYYRMHVEPTEQECNDHARGDRAGCEVLMYPDGSATVNHETKNIRYTLTNDSDYGGDWFVGRCVSSSESPLHNFWVKGRFILCTVSAC